MANFFGPKKLGRYSYNPLGIFSKKKKKQETYEPPPYTGMRPYSGADVGFDAAKLKTIGDQYTNQILERSRGEGLVGYDPAYRSTLRNEFLADFGDYEDDIMKNVAAQASGQGLRGGIPASISASYAKNLSRARQSGLAEIDIADLEGRREDINAATYAQPGAVQLGSGIQQNRANFDLAEYQETAPVLVDQEQSNIWPALIGAAGTVIGSIYGGPVGGAAGGAAGNAIGSAFTQSSKKPANNSGISDAYLRTPSFYRRGLSSVY